MKAYQTPKSPLGERVFYELEDIERICLEELRNVGLYPREPEPIRIERFIEKRFSISAKYEEVPEGVLGFSLFGKDGIREIVVSKNLVEEGTAVSERRVNSTLAHESGHGLLHTHLFANYPNCVLPFDGSNEPNEPKILCRDIPGNQQRRASYSGKWWEFQANRAIGCLLLPKPLVEAALDYILTPKGSLGLKTLNPLHRGEAIKSLSEVFNVNPIVVSYRLEEMYPSREEAQLAL